MEIKIYLTNLAKYNEGYLVGEWINLSEVSKDQLKEAIKRIMGTDEEWFITDYEAPFRIDEYENVFKLHEFAQEVAGLQSYEEAGVIYLIEQGESIETLLNDGLQSRIDDLIVYQADTIEDLAEQFVDEGLYGDIPEQLQYYIDYEKISRDLDMEYNEVEVDGVNYFIANN